MFVWVNDLKNLADLGNDPEQATMDVRAVLSLKLLEV